MPLISVLTAAHVGAAPYLTDTIEGVNAQELPPGWKLEWIVQEDGAEPCLTEHFAGLDFVRYDANGAQLGPASTRNLALSRASGDLVQVLDSDDVLLPGALATLIPRFAGTAIHWTIGQADDLMPDGTRVSWDSALPYGRIPAGQVNQWAREHDANWPIHCAGLMIRTASLRAIGGWVGIPYGEDIAVLSALSEAADGYNDEAVTWLYRQHPEQISRSEAWRARAKDGRRIALQRADAARRMQLTFGPGAALDLTDDSLRTGVSVGPTEKPRPSV